MVKENRKKHSLTRPATYQIKVPGHLDRYWLDGSENITITIESERDGQPVSVLTTTIDQAALHGLLRRLYSLGIPLISVHCLEVK